jgi:hypothetical protein
MACFSKTANPAAQELFALLLVCSAFFGLGCAGGGQGTPPNTGLTVTLGSNMALAPQDGTPAQISVSLVRAAGDTGSVTLSVSGLPPGVTATFSQPGSGDTGSVTFVANSTAAAGTYSATIKAQDPSASAVQSLSLVVAIAATVNDSIATNQGINGKLNEFMSTSFQPAEWDYPYFQNHATLEPAQLNSLGSQHIRIQGLSQAVPMKANSQPPQPSDWDFSELDAVVQPVLSVADNSPEFQIAVAPDLPGMLDSSGHLIVNAANLNTFATYCANLVRYYNKGGFDWGGAHFQSQSSHPITWWGIFNEYNINGLTPGEYVQLYNAVVPAMLAVDPTIKFSALELSDYDYQVGDPRNNLPTFLSAANAGGVNAQVNVLSTHFYSSCDQLDTDAQVFSTIPGFVSDLKYFYQELQLRPDLLGVSVWVTENNMNADYANSSGNSTCTPTQKFVTDHRGSSAFFAAWRPYVFSQLGKAGNQALYHWDYDADAQFGEVDYTTGNKYLSYWVDYWLARTFPAPSGSSGMDILALTATETSTVEILAARSSDGTVNLLVADHAVHSSSDNNGAGDPRTVILDFSPLGNFSSVFEIMIDQNTNLSNGPTPMSLTPSSKMTVSLGGYGVAFLTLKP